jgi:hypothetical protein
LRRFFWSDKGCCDFGPAERAGDVRGIAKGVVQVYLPLLDSLYVRLPHCSDHFGSDLISTNEWAKSVNAPAESLVLPRCYVSDGIAYLVIAVVEKLNLSIFYFGVFPARAFPVKARIERESFTDD